MKKSKQNAVSAVLLIPTTIMSVLFSFLLLILASLGALHAVFLGALTVACAANIVMWSILARALHENHVGSTLSMRRRWLYYLVFGAGQFLVVCGVRDPGGSIWVPMALGCAALTLVHFGVLTYRSPVATPLSCDQTDVQ